MGREDWYRLETWSKADQEAFFARLNRSRGVYRKSQYARIQASYLQNVGLVDEALQLLQRLYDEWPDNSQLATAYWQEANCYLLKKELDAAIEAYRKCFRAEEDNDFRSTTNARVEFLWLVATKGLKDLYDEALQEIDKLQHPGIFPVDQYRTAGALALIKSDSGVKENTASLAKAALGAASRSDSGLRYHKGLGLVRNPDREIIKRLKRLAAESD